MPSRVLRLEFSSGAWPTGSAGVGPAPTAFGRCCPPLARVSPALRTSYFLFPLLALCSAGSFSALKYELECHVQRRPSLKEGTPLSCLYMPHLWLISPFPFLAPFTICDYSILFFLSVCLSILPFVCCQPPGGRTPSIRCGLLRA